MLCSLVLAAGNNIQKPNKWITNVQEKTTEKTQVRGLENAMLRVRNEEQKQHINKVMEKIQDKKKEQLTKLNNLIFEEDENGMVEATGQAEALFLYIFKIKRTFTYQINEEGEIKYKKRWHYDLWKIPPEIENLQ